MEVFFMNKQEIIELFSKGLEDYFEISKLEEAKDKIRSLVEKICLAEDEKKPLNNGESLKLFIEAKRIEGCSEKSLNYYRTTLLYVLSVINKEYYLINTEDLRSFLSNHKEKHNVSKTTIDNIRRIISTFFSWLENEDYISKSPCRRIHKVRTGKMVKEVYSDETIELIKQSTKNKRDLAIIEVLISTGIRVGELVRMNISDVDFENKECVVLGKGNKQRKVYFDAKTKIHLKQYLESRADNNDALFVSLLKPYDRLEISGVEIMLRKIGKRIGIDKVHPHKFRRTLATKAIDKGMPIEQVQHLLGHAKIDTTLEYAMVDDTNVKISHKKYLE